MTESAALGLYRRASLHELGEAADERCRRLHGEPFRTYAIDRNINYTNICRSRCRFCAYYARPGREGFVLPMDELLTKVAELSAAGGTHVLLQGGLNEQLGLGFHLDMLRAVRAAFPAIGLHAFSPPEIWFMHEQSGLSLPALLEALRQAGLDSIPGGGAEILADDVRRAVSPRKCTAQQWLAVMRNAHRLGMNATATMMYGHGESDERRIEHLRRLRELQDESLAAGAGRFTAFICWPFQSGNTELAADPAAADRFDPGAYTYLRTLAIARLYLDNFVNVQASWVTQGPKIGQLALFYGANDMGGAMMEENVVAAAGTVHRLSPVDLARLIRQAGWEPRQRDCQYRIVGP